MHLTFYRQFRPNTFDKVIGQEHITKTLSNEVMTGNISHSYLFTGSRGTGKTTCARIFSKAVNCLNPVNGSPCGQCEVCKALSEPNNTDIIEIDAASNNKVDEIRDLREKIKFPPIIGKYKVYIIDEVHMLTDSAFNALLKTLEEPPKHALFILATTEVHKLPATILSRCLRFDFRLLQISDLEKLLTEVFKRSDVRCDAESLRRIAIAGQGSARDCLSIADSVASFCSNNITIDKTKEILGTGNISIVSDIMNSICEGDAKELYILIKKALEKNISINVLCKEMCEFLKNLMLINSGLDKSKLDLLESDYEYFEKLKGVEKYKISEAFSKFANTELDLKYSLSPENLFYSSCLSLIDYNQKKIDNLGDLSMEQPNSKKTENLQKNESKNEKNEQKVENSLNFIDDSVENAFQNNVSKEEKTKDTDAGKLFGKVLIEVKNKNLFALYTALKNIYNVQLLEDGKTLKLHTNDKTSFSLLDEKARIDVLLNIVKGLDSKVENIKIEFDTGTKSEKDAISCLKDLFGNKIKIEE